MKSLCSLFLCIFLLLAAGCSLNGGTPQDSTLKASDDDFQGYNTPRNEVFLHPTPNFPAACLAALKEELQHHLDEIYIVDRYIVAIGKEFQLVESDIDPSTHSFRAENLLLNAYQYSNRNDVIHFIVTDRKISTTLYGHNGAIVEGFSTCPGNAAIISSHTFQNGKKQAHFWKLAMREFLHTRGLTRCAKNVPTCLMYRSPEGASYAGKKELCPSCLSILAAPTKIAHD